MTGAATGAATAAGAAGAACAARAAAGAAGAATGGEAAGPAGASSGHGQRNQLMIQTWGRLKCPCLYMSIHVFIDHPKWNQQSFFYLRVLHPLVLFGEPKLFGSRAWSVGTRCTCLCLWRALIACHFSMLETEVHVSAQHHLKDAHNWVHLGLNRLNTWPNCWWIWWTKILAAAAPDINPSRSGRRFRTSDSQVDLCRLVKQLVSQPETEIQMVPYSISCWSWWYLEGWGPFCIATEGSSKTEKGKVCKADSTPVLRGLFCFLLVNVGQFSPKIVPCFSWTIWGWYRLRRQLEKVQVQRGHDFCQSWIR